MEARAITSTLEPRLAESLARGYTLPLSWYSEPVVLELEKERVFKSTWQYAGHASRALSPGSYFASQVAGIPVAVVRDRQGKLNAFVNVCRHRGHLVVQGEGRRETLQCPYHAWTYGLDGCLRTAPRSEREQGFEKSELSLLPLAIDTWGPLVFVNPDPDAAPLASVLGELPQKVEEHGTDLSSLSFGGRFEWDVAANWKVVVENFLECYHCPVAHPSFSELIDVDPDAYRLEAHEWFSSQYGPVRASALAGGRNGAPYDPRGGEVEASQFHYLWPSFTLNVLPGRANMFLFWFEPLGPGRTRTFTEYYLGPDVPESVVQEMLDFFHVVGAEDTSLVEVVQRGIESGMVSQGRLMPESEMLIRHFQQLVYQALS